MATLVRFLVNEDFTNKDVFAYFPQINADHSGNKQSYSHIGQHSACSPYYAKQSRLATEEEYKPLLNELKSIGYENLRILKSRNKRLLTM